jgi:deoxycytidine triphosphate deaminase
MLHIASYNSSSSLSHVQTEDVQPNACDLRLKQVFTILSQPFYINNVDKQHRGRYELMPTNNQWILHPGVYEIIMEGTVRVGPDEAGWVITRSSLNRNGVFITSGLYDSGYFGPMAGCLHVNGGDLVIEVGTRIGQFLLFKAEALHNYQGSYGYTADGLARAEQAKFGY